MARPKKDTGDPSARTRIVGAFSELAVIKPASYITVGAVCTRARCGKTTFYYHFASIEDLWDSYLAEAGLAQHSKQIHEMILRHGWDSLDEGSFRAAAKTFDTFSKLVTLNIGSPMGVKIRRFIRQMVGETLSLPDEVSPAQGMLAEYITGGVVGLYLYCGEAEEYVPYRVAMEMYYTSISPALLETNARLKEGRCADVADSGARDEPHSPAMLSRA